ncbi:MAG: hypothetical protein QNJ18_18210 [Xenococcaceae cyanobacterium MO_167.B52]|nr:hypothetical protein [Xenococcaceae cyanobacterium MO_167.B52]
MTRHDTLVRLKPGNPFETVLHLFDGGWIPVRDPWGMCTGKRDGKTISLFCVDKDRVTQEQEVILAACIAGRLEVSTEEVLQEAEKDGITFDSDWVEAMTGEAECYRRTLELADFLEAHPTPDEFAYREFIEQQYCDWIHGDRIPEPMPENYEDVDPRYKSPELEQAYKQREIDRFLQQGGYSVFDVLTGKAMIDALNYLDPDSEYSLVGPDEFLEQE